jgi:ankyrin repeat protein
MIKDSPDLINARDSGGKTPLHQAAQKGQLVVATFLLENGAEVDTKDKNAQTPLHLATSEGHKAMMELLLAHNADVQVKSNASETPTALHLAALRGFRNLVELLLAHKADVNARTSTGPTPLHLAAANGFKVIAEVLLKNGADVNLLASSFSSAGLNNLSGTPLHITARRGDVPLAELLLNSKADPNAKLEDGQTPLHFVANSGSDAIARLLIEHGAEVNPRTKSGDTPLVFAIFNHKTEVAKVLLGAKVDPNIMFEPSEPGAASKERTPLYLAVSNPNPDAELVKLLLQSGANPNVKDEQDRQTPLIAAVRNQRKEIVSMLLIDQADPNTPDGAGETALHYAAAQPDIVEDLLGAKAEVNAKDKNDETAMHWAAGCGSKPTAELLVGAKADVNARDSLGNTPLHFAVLAGRSEMVDWLLGKKADPNVPNQSGQTPLDWAKTGFPANWVQVPNKAAFPRPARPGPSGLSAPPMPGSVGVAYSSSQPREEISSTLKAHGALLDLPHLDRIEVKRPSSGYSATVLYKGTNDWNQFTVLEALAMRYEFLADDPSREGTPRETRLAWANRQRLAFPDLGAVQIRRPEADLKTWHEQKVDLRPLFASGDCSKDVPLSWGEVVEVPEADHPLNDRWQGFSEAELLNLKKCLSRKVQVIIKGRATQLNLAPEFITKDDNGVINIIINFSIWIKPALRQSDLLLASSDLSRIKVTRLDPATRQKREWVLDCSDRKSAPAFWLRDGDVIEVPERP